MKVSLNYLPLPIPSTSSYSNQTLDNGIMSRMFYCSAIGGQCYKIFVHNLLIFGINWSVWPLQAFPA
jgi:hypothetical protein